MDHDGVFYTGAGEWKGEGIFRNHLFIKTEDNGITWEFVSSINNPSDIEAVEKGFEYSGDSIFVFVSSFGRGYDGKPGSKVLHGYSCNLGKSWEKWNDSIDITGVWDRPRIYTLAHLKGQKKWWNDDILIGCGNNTPEPGVAFPRRNAIWYSVNKGDTRSEPLPVHKFYRDGGYGDLQFNKKENKIVYVVDTKGIVNISTLEPGLYSLRVFSKEGSAATQFIKIDQ